MRHPMHKSFYQRKFKIVFELFAKILDELYLCTEFNENIF